MGYGSTIDIDSLVGGGPCQCGRDHTLRTRRILIGSGAVCEAGNAARLLGLTGRALVVADGNTWNVAGPQTLKALERAGFAADVCRLPAGELHTDEKTVGSIFLALMDDTAFLVAVGSGTINDGCRFVARRSGLPYFVVGTAPSMDGYASDVTPVNREGFKQTYRGVAPLAVVGDTDVLSAAPANMKAAGLGDVFGKITALMDWRMAQQALGEYRCERVASIMQTAVDACMTAAPGLEHNDGQAVEGLMKGLVLSGLAMQMVNDSRPASGCEHHVAHFLEMRDLSRGRSATLHGDKVGMAEILMLRLYEKFFAVGGIGELNTEPLSRRQDEMRRSLGAFAETVIAQGCSAKYDSMDIRRSTLDSIAANWTAWQDEAKKLPGLRLAGEQSIRRSGGPVRPGEMGYSREDIALAIRYAMELRDKFTILRLAHHTGRLDGLAEELADEFC